VTYERFVKGKWSANHKIILTGPSGPDRTVHHADSRDIFALGALLAAQWTVGQEAGSLLMMQKRSEVRWLYCRFSRVT